MAKRGVSFVEKMLRFKKAGLQNVHYINHCRSSSDEMMELDERLRYIIGITQTSRKGNNMIFFVMYDVANDKVRHQIVKYLQREGCVRVQKSIFLADLPVTQYDKIRNDLAEVQACYENEDSILIVPISTDYLHAMKIIGQSINMDLIVDKPNTLFF